MEGRERNLENLRSGYTTGACAAAAAKAAALILLGKGPSGEVEIPFPGGSRVKFRLEKEAVNGPGAMASVVKDAGDDPDVTNGAEIVATATFTDYGIEIKGGEGVGIVTRPGLAVPPGGPSINPVPKRMIKEAVAEALREAGSETGLEITISVPEGERLARKTLNARLGIVGGISILGTTGIVKPLSGEAWKATVKSGMDVARATGLEEVVLSSGRTSELAHMRKFNLLEASYILTGDFVEYSLLEAKAHAFERVYISAQWAKMLKIAMGTPDTHVRTGVLDVNKAALFLAGLGVPLPARDYNTAREIFDILSGLSGAEAYFKKVCSEAGRYAEKVSGLRVVACLASYGGDIIACDG